MIANSKNRLTTMKTLLSSPRQKAQVRFSDQNMSIVRGRCRCRKLFTFSSSSPEPLG